MTDEKVDTMQDQNLTVSIARASQAGLNEIALGMADIASKVVSRYHRLDGKCCFCGESLNVVPSVSVDVSRGLDVRMVSGVER